MDDYTLALQRRLEQKLQLRGIEAQEAKGRLEQNLRNKISV